MEKSKGKGARLYTYIRLQHQSDSVVSYIRDTSSFSPVKKCHFEFWITCQFVVVVVVVVFFSKRIISLIQPVSVE